MTISSGVAFLLSTSTIAGTTAAKAALTRIVFGMGAIATAFMATMASSFRKSSRAGDRPHPEEPRASAASRRMAAAACFETRSSGALLSMRPRSLPLEQPHDLGLGQRIEMQIEADDGG